ncbi:MAG: ERCC4 domain-containing protein [Candidatus Poribacteria bacterium]
MSVDLSELNISVTKPFGKPAAMLAEMDINIIPIEEDEGNVDRYIISNRLAIDRWTGSTFVQGIIDKNLFSGAIYLREHFNAPIIILEGDISHKCRMVNPQMIRGAMSSLMVLYGVNILSTPDVEETVSLITMIARQEQIGIKEISLIPKRKAVTLDDMQRRVIEMLPGCGMVMARDLLQYFGSIKNIVNATEDEFRSVPGVGAKKAEEVYKVLNAEYESIDTEKALEDAIESDPQLLFDQQITLVSRQHYIFTEGKERHIIDMVFYDQQANELILVELKRGRLFIDHYYQIRRYVDNAPKSEILRSYLEKGASIRGILATVEECKLDLGDSCISVHIVDRNKAIKVLKRIRDDRLRH